MEKLLYLETVESQISHIKNFSDKMVIGMKHFFSNSKKFINNLGSKSHHTFKTTSTEGKWYKKIWFRHHSLKFFFRQLNETDTKQFNKQNWCWTPRKSVSSGMTIHKSTHMFANTKSAEFYCLKIAVALKIMTHGGLYIFTQFFFFTVFPITCFLVHLRG